LRIQYLLEAYRRLESASHRVGNERAYWEALESATADIQLLGSPAQAEMAEQFCQEIAQRRIGNLDSLLTDLRTSLRAAIAPRPSQG
jgi:hypothetical protein